MLTRRRFNTCWGRVLGGQAHLKRRSASEMAAAEAREAGPACTGHHLRHATIRRRTVARDLGLGMAPGLGLELGLEGGSSLWKRPRNVRWSRGWADVSDPSLSVRWQPASS
eukprot:2139521-Rhodomonas_salina.1